MRLQRYRRRWSISKIGLPLILLTAAQPVRSQDSHPPPPPSVPGTGNPAQPVAQPISMGQLAQQLRELQEANRRLTEQLDKTTKQHNEQMNVLLQKYGELSKRFGDEATGRPPDYNTPGMAPVPPAAGTDPTGDAGSPVPDYYSFESEPPYSDPHYRISNIANPKKVPLQANFGPGFQLQTDDEEFRLQVHILSQVEARVWGDDGHGPPDGGFFFPRQRIFFNGRITKPIEYVFSINRGLNSIDLLDAFLNIHLDDRFQVRFGRYMTPLTYEQFAIRPMWLPTPERSLFTTNLGLNRQIGLMAWGYLFDHRLDYAAGIFNGSRNSFQNLGGSPDFIAYANARPFQDSEEFWFLKYLNLGSSVAVGYADQTPVPAALRIGAVSPDAALPGVASMPFLVFNPDVVERGNRLLGSVHGAYFYKGLSLLGEWQYGYAGYATSTRPSSVSVPISGFYATAAYFLTGEHIESRTMIQPRRPLFPTNKAQIRGPGAWEAVARVSELQVGKDVFTGGLADPNLWANSAVTTELGLNWYWNENFKIYMFWLHGDFNDPVFARSGTFQKSANMFWLRCQLWF